MTSKDSQTGEKIAPAFLTEQERAPAGYGAGWIFIGPGGLRAGWTALIFLAVATATAMAAGGLFLHLGLIARRPQFTASAAFLQELVAVIALLAGAGVAAFLEQRNPLDYYLRGPRSARRFLSGALCGFLGLSLLAGLLAAGGWLRFAPAELAGWEILRMGALWAAAFLLVGCFEEGVFRCFLQFTLARGLNFWWALAAQAVICALLALSGKGESVWGVYVSAALGLIPCLALERRRRSDHGFWQAAWVTSTVFGMIHVGNGGEGWIGVFAAALIGFVFCVSVRLTGSAWWAIGCHASWDWAETFFYGASDSGNAAVGHFLTTTPAGSALWSGGNTGPEGSLLALLAILLLLAALVALYGRRKPPSLS